MLIRGDLGARAGNAPPRHGPHTNVEQGLSRDPISPVTFMDYRALPAFTDAAAWWRDAAQPDLALIAWSAALLVLAAVVAMNPPTQRALKLDPLDAMRA